MSNGLGNGKASNAGFDTKFSSNAVKKLYLNEKTADVHFVLQSSERIPAHKNLLVAASDVFDTMFYGSSPETGDIKVDASVGAFKEFLQFFYLPKVKLTMENIGDVMKLCDKYNMNECIDLCAKFSQQNLSPENVCKVYALAFIHNQNELKWKCQVEISNHTEKVLKSSEFLECSKNILANIFKFENFSCSEVNLFEAGMLWVKKASKQNDLTREIMNEHLGNLFFEIRFRSMSQNEFYDLLPAYGQLFLANELLEILQMFRSKEYQPTLFNGMERSHIRIEWNENNVLHCDRYLESVGNYLIQNVDITKFTTNKTLLLGKVVCAPIFRNDNYYQSFEMNVPVEVTIVRDPGNTNASQTGKVLYNGQFQLDNVGVMVINLPSPILVRAGVEYGIRLDVKRSVYGFWKLKPRVQVASDIDVVFYANSDRGDKGLIAALTFNRVN